MFPINELTDHLISLEVKDIYFCAGSRNSSLLNDLKKYFNLFYRVDERSASFEALGMSRIKDKPVVVCVTSGTAVSECYSALIEAHYSFTKLIIISADRPENLRDTFAPQTIDQIGIFGKFARTFVNLGLDNVFQKSVAYPYHINIEIDDKKSISLDGKSDNSFELVVITYGASNIEDEIRELEERGAYFYIECTSHYKGIEIKNKIFYEQTILSILEKNQISRVIKFGHTPFTKIWRVLESRYDHVPVFSFQNSKTGLSRGEVITELPGNIVNSNEQLLEKNISDLVIEFPESEIGICSKLLSSFNEDDIVFVGNSMAIRYWQLIDDSRIQVMASRGVNGIDGQISTAIGIARGTHRNVHCILGDLTTLYDFNVLCFDLPSNFTLTILNNFGGRIFEQVNSPKEMIFEHNINMKKLISGLTDSNKKKITEYKVNNDQSNLFWKEWNK